ncbi:MAG: YegS/Rv2252/BmrU family lipid kinase [Clostridia bacterium]|nr:YegS/Rv2252/BmrU family lipid kinase [Clostridia bacterium]
MAKSLLLIVNPIAGKRHAVDYQPEIVDKFQEAGYDVQVRYTEIDKNAYYVTKKYGKDSDIIVCCGGDGTLKETVCGIMELNLKAQIGYIPCGTTNDFAHSLNIPTDLDDAIETILDGHTMAIDIGDFNGAEQFIYVSCFGNFCDVSYKAKQSLKNKVGRAAYYWETAKEITKLKSYKAKIECDDGEVIEGNFFYGGVSNSYSVAGFPVLKKSGVEFDDGLHELALIRMPKNPAQLVSILNAMFVTRDVINNKYLVLKRGKEFKFYFENEVNLTLDGENGGNHSFTHIKTYENAVKIFCNKIED